MSRSTERRFSGIKDVISHLNAVGSRGLAAIGSKSSRAKQLQDDEKTVTLQVGRSVFSGAPRNMRSELWMSSLQRKGIGVAASQKYEDMLLSPVGAEAAADIEKDLGRTFPTLRRFAAPEGQEALGRVLRAYAAFDPEVGYCQGLNFVVGLLLMYLSERHAFGGLVVLMQDRGLRKYYSVDMSLLQTHLWQLGRLIPSRLCSHLESIGVLPLLYGASWLMTCFSADFPASFSARVMDVIMADKMDQALLKAAVALLRRCAARLLTMTDMEDALHLLKLELPAWEEPLLHDVLTDAFSKPWSSRQMQLLGSLEGAETVAEALTRVQKANLLAASTDSLLSTDSAGGAAAAGEDADGGAAAASAGGAQPATPSGAAAAAAGAGSRAGSAGGVVLPLFPPPPSPKRPSSTGGGGSGRLSPAASRPASRATSQCGVLLQGVSEGCEQHAAASTLPKLAVPTQQQQQQLHDMIDMSSPRASTSTSPPAAAAAAVGVGASSSSEDQRLWDPFGLLDAASHSHQQHHQHHHQHHHGSRLHNASGQPPAVDTLDQQLHDLSFTQLRSPPAQAQQTQPSQQQPSQQQQQQQDAGGDDDWGDFVGH